MQHFTMPRTPRAQILKYFERESVLVKHFVIEMNEIVYFLFIWEHNDRNQPEICIQEMRQKLEKHTNTKSNHHRRQLKYSCTLSSR